MSTPFATVHDRYSDEQISAYYAAGYWQPTSFSDVVAEQARLRPDKLAFFDSMSGYTYRELCDTSDRLGVGLRQLGIAAGDRVVVQLPNWKEFVLCATALAGIGAVIVPIMPIYRDDEVGYVLNHSGAKLVITCEHFKGFDYLQMYLRLQPEAPALQQVVVVRGVGRSPAVDLTELIAGDVEVTEPGPAVSPDDPLLIVYTSGTTSRPKGCLQTFNTLRASSSAIAASLRYTEHDVQFGPSPVGHGTGLVTSLVLPLIAGASSYLMESWDAQQALERIAQYRCTVATTATAFLQMLMAGYDPARHDASSMRLWVCAGAPIPGAVVERASAMFAGCRVLSLYGRSENFLTTMCTVDDPPQRSLTSDGSALAGAEVVIVDADGRPVPAGVEGDIAYRGPSHMLEYYRDPEHSADLFTPDGFSRSGDLGVMDDAGFVRVTGRLKDIVIRGGLNISARELEELLLRHPAVADVAVVAMPDERLGEKVCAYVVAAPGAQPPTLADVTGFLREQKLATPKLPERIEVLDALPMTATGKVQKHVLRADVLGKLQAETAGR